MNKKVISVLLSVALVSQIRVAPYVCASDVEGSYESQAEGIDVSSDLRLLGEWIGGTLMTVMGLGFLAGLLSGDSKQQQPAQQQGQRRPQSKEPLNVEVPPRVLKNGGSSSGQVSFQMVNGQTNQGGGDDSRRRQTRALETSAYPPLTRSASMRPTERTRPRSMSASPHFNSQPPLAYIPLAHMVHGGYQDEIILQAKRDEMRNFMQSITPKKTVDLDIMHDLCQQTQALLAKESTLLRIQGPVIVAGDIHGMLPSAKYCVNDFLDHVNTHSILFLGDFVGKGRHSTQCIALFFKLKILFPKKVFLIRGNHDVSDYNLLPEEGFWQECLGKYSGDASDLHASVSRVFDWLPIAAVINDKIFCVHGGIPNAASGVPLTNLCQISNIQRPITWQQTNGDLIDRLLWSDPWREEADTTGHSRKKMYDETDVDSFFAATGCTRILRAHEGWQNGYRMFLNNKVISIYSAANQYDASQGKGLDNVGMVLYCGGDKSGKTFSRNAQLRDDACQALTSDLNKIDTI